MSRTRTAIATAIAVFAFGGSAAAETWTQVDGPISSGPVQLDDTPFSAANSDLKQNGNQPYVAWVDDGVLRVSRLVGDEWEAVDGPVNRNTAAEAFGPSLAAGPSEHPWIAWIEDQGGMDRVRVARFEPISDSWVEVAPSSTINNITSPDPGLSSARQVRIVFIEGRPYVVWRQENPSAFEVNVVRLSVDGTKWERLARPPISQEPYHVSAHVAGGALHTAIRDLLGGVEVSRYAASSNTWTALDALANPRVDGEPVPAGTPTPLASLDGVVHVLSSTSAGIFVTRFTGGAWETVGGPIGLGDASSIRVVGGRLYVAWADDAGAHVSRLNAARTGWEEPAALPAGAVDSGILTGANNVPYVSYTTADGLLHVARLEGAPVEGPDDSDDSGPLLRDCSKEVLGTRRNDRLTGTGAGDFLAGLRGNDLIRGLGGNDCLFGGRGDDRIEGGEGADFLSGNEGNDTLISGGGHDVVDGSLGNDFIDSRGSGWDVIDCGPGRDRALVGDRDRVRNCERVLNVD